MTFESVDTNGATNGIVLNNAGSGGFTITGDGTAGDRTGSGGTINNADEAIQVTNTTNVSINHVDITTVTGSATTKGAVNLSSATNVSLADVEINDSNAHGVLATSSSNIGIVDTHVLSAGDGAGEDGIHFSEVTGTNLIDSSLIDGLGGHMENGIEIKNTSGTSTVTIRDTTIEDNATLSATTAFADHGIDIDTHGTATVTVNVEDSTIQTIDGIGISVISSTNAATTSQVALNVSGTTIQDVTGGIHISTINGQSGSFNIVDGITIQDTSATPILINGDDTGTLRGTIGNTTGNAVDDVVIIGTDSTADGIGTTNPSDSDAISVTSRGGSTVIVDINNVDASLLGRRDLYLCERYVQSGCSANRQQHHRYGQ